MKKSTIALIISFAALALIGILIIQLYWMKNALRLQEELFNNQITVTLKTVVNRMFDERTAEVNEPFVCNPGCDHLTKAVLSAINTVRLDSLLHEEFSNSEITKDHVWGIFDPATGTFYAGENMHQRSNILHSKHQISLSCLYRHEQIMLGVYFPNENELLRGKLLPWMILSLIFVLVVVFAFSYTIFSFMKQKKLSEIKADFVNNMTHELKTPISTISLASEMLLSQQSTDADDKTRKYARMIFDENQRMQQQVEHVLQMAVLEKGTFKLEISSFDAHKLIGQCIYNFELAIKNAHGSIEFYPRASDYNINADQAHFLNIICNLIDNAVKYSSESPEIKITTRNENGMFVVAFSDKGIGISADNQKMIFDKLYRVPTGDLHDVKGFGLGLYYVKTITEALKGRVKVKSEPGKGSTFEVWLPVNVMAEAYER